MPNFTPRLPKRGTVFRVITFTVVGGLIAFVLLAAYVYKQSVGKFELRRLSLPTRVYADYTPLRPGMPIGADDVFEKLDRLGYRNVQTLAQPGDFIPGKGSIDIYTRASSHLSGKYTAQQ